MKKDIARTDIYSVSFYILIINVLIFFWVTDSMILPQFSQLRDNMDNTENSAVFLAKLKRNISIQSGVDNAISEFSDVIDQSGTDHVTLSDFLQLIESKSSQNAVSIVNLKPLPVQKEGVVRRYGVKMAINGRLPEILKFIHHLTHSGNVIGIESFGLRGMQRSNEVECSIIIYMVRTISGDRKTTNTPTGGEAI